MKKHTRVIGLAIDEPVETPTSKTDNDQIHDQVQKQQWSCHVPSHSLSHRSLKFHTQRKTSNKSNSSLGISYKISVSAHTKLTKLFW